MDVMASHFLQTVRHYRLNISLRRAMIKNVGRGLFLKFKIYLNRMPLAGAYSFARSIESKTLFITRFDDFVEFGSCKGSSMVGTGF